MGLNGIWLSVVEYANYKNISISTIRRSIKSGHLTHKEVGGKYFIWTKEIVTNAQQEIEKMRKENRDLKEEINDLKMLLLVYENRSTEELPPIPTMAQ